MHSCLDAGKLWNAVLLVDLVEANARDVLAHQDAPPEQQSVINLLDHPTQEVFSEVGHFRVLVHNQYPPRFQHTLTDSFPVIGKDAAQVNDVEIQTGFAVQRVGGLRAQQQSAPI